MRIKQVGSDGNCLFRAISHQVYGTEDHHKYIRQRCMDYIEAEKDYFKNYIIGSSQLIDQYIERKRVDGTWGDDIEIQALSELYNAAIEVYSYNSYPMKTFREETLENGRVLRLSYHRRSHFNSIIVIANENRTGLDRVISHTVGTLEDLTFSNIELAKQSNFENELGYNEEEKADSRLALNTLIDNVSLAKQYRDIVMRSRQEYQDKGARDLEMAMQESLSIIHNKDGDDDEEEKKAIEDSKKVYENQLAEDELLKIALQESLHAGGSPQASNNSHYEEMMLEQALRNSVMESANNMRVNPVVELARSMGLSDDIAMDALAQANNNESEAIQFLYNLFQ